MSGTWCEWQIPVRYDVQELVASADTQETVDGIRVYAGEWKYPGKVEAVLQERGIPFILRIDAQDTHESNATIFYKGETISTYQDGGDPFVTVYTDEQGAIKFRGLTHCLEYLAARRAFYKEYARATKEAECPPTE